MGDRIPEWLRRLLGRKAPSPPPTVHADATGFSLTSNRETRAVPWQLVRRVAAFKEDLHTHDRVVLLIDVARGGDPVLRVPEDCPGFATLFGPMEEALGIDPGWYLTIMTPSFAPTPTVLYVRAAEE
jgi:hypothetical protein